MFLMGTPGTGKTHLSCAIVRAVIEATGRPAYIVTVSAFVRAIRATWRGNGGADYRADSEQQVLNRYGRADLLVLDDVGASFGADGELKHLLDLVDERYTLQLPTLIVSNLAEGELLEALGERIFDRLREGARRVVFNWSSHRRIRPVADELQAVHHVRRRQQQKQDAGGPASLVTAARRGAGASEPSAPGPGPAGPGASDFGQTSNDLQGT